MKNIINTKILSSPEEHIDIKTDLYNNDKI